MRKNSKAAQAKESRPTLQAEEYSAFSNAKRPPVKAAFCKLFGVRLNCQRSVAVSPAFLRN